MANEFPKVERRIGNEVKTMPNLPKGTRHGFVKAIDSDGVMLFFANHFVDPNGKPLSGSELDLDPKALLFRGQRYVKDETWRDPAKDRRLFGWFYAKYRKLLCRLMGR